MARPAEEARTLAKVRGDKRYVSVRPCRLGHVERYTNSTGCCACAVLQQEARLGRPVKQTGPRARKVKEPVAVEVERKPFALTRPGLLLNDYYGSASARDRSRHLDETLRRKTGL